eukprot:Hpha_TRINITY_DN18499_c0_g1::TRINITY_DN18499_c0_g1_i1::g.165320::m.165320/K00721/DPM1; dolichol-phosphate mannosyltransferase
MGEVDISVIVPTYREAANIPALCRRLFDAAKGADKKVELIIVDDNSPDGTKEVCAGLEPQYPGLQLIVRTKERGLSSAVLKGFDSAKGRVLVCMDGDLQHPPECVPELARQLKGGINFALGSRYVGDAGIDRDWPVHRRVISWGARTLALPLTAMSDPMSGFFAVDRDTYAKARPLVSPVGYKIALEIYVKAGIRRLQLREIPFTFGKRVEGESKLTGKVIVHYLQHLYGLYNYQYGALLKMLAVLVLVIVVYFLKVFFL